MMKRTHPLWFVLFAFVTLKTFEGRFFSAWSNLDFLDHSNKTPVRRSTTSTVAVKNNSDAPLFILHVGPGKTATTTVQYGAAVNAKLLEKDNIHYLGHFGRKHPEWDLHQLCRVCYDHLERKCTSRWEQLESIVNYHFQQNHTVFLSEEMLSGFKNEEDEMKNLWSHLDPLLSRWRVRILYSYRRYQDWIPSKYHQGYNPSAGVPGKTKLNWPGSGGKCIPSLRTYFDNMMIKRSFTLPSETIRRWSAHFPNVRVYNMHDAGNTDFLQSFFCKMLPEAKRLCQYLTKNDLTAEIKNPSSKKALHYDMLATGAFTKGLVDKTLKRVDVAKAIEIHAKGLGLLSVSDFALECLTRNQTQMLLNVSISYESEVLPKFHSSGGKKELKSKHAEALERKSLCSVDIEQTLQERRWQKFFDNLNSEALQNILASSA